MGLTIKRNFIISYFLAQKIVNSGLIFPNRFSCGKFEFFARMHASEEFKYKSTQSILEASLAHAWSDISIYSLAIFSFRHVRLHNMYEYISSFQPLSLSLLVSEKHNIYCENRSHHKA